MNTFFVDAAAAGNLAAVERLLAAGADVHEAHDTALRRASESGYMLVVARLLAAGADVHADYDHALCLACEHGHLPVIERLLAAGADVHAQDDDALRVASENYHLPVIVLLLAAGADSRQIVWSRHRPHWCELLLLVPSADVLGLPESLRPLWLRLHVRVRVRLTLALQRARARLDRRPPTPLGTVLPTRAELTTHMKTGGRRFAREFWTDGLPRRFPNQDFGPVPDEFVFRGL